MQNHKNKLFIKTRPLYNLRAYQLLREVFTTRLARRLLPERVGSFDINIPIVKATISTKGIFSSSSWITGEELLIGLYDENKREIALKIVLKILQAFYDTKHSIKNRFIFSFIYRPIRVLKVVVFELTHGILTKDQKKTIIKLLLKHLITLPKEKVIVHGNLHAENILVNYHDNSLGIIDMEMLHIGSPIIDFAMIWLSIYFLSPQIACNFFHKVKNHLQYLMVDKNLENILVELAIESYLMIIKAKQNHNAELEIKSKSLLLQILTCGDFQSLLVAEE